MKKNVFSNRSKDGFKTFLFGRSENPGFLVQGVECELSMEFNSRRCSKNVNTVRFDLKNNLQRIVSSHVEVKNFRYEEDVISACNKAIEDLLLAASVCLGEKKRQLFEEQKKKVGRLGTIIRALDTIVQRVKDGKDERFTIKDEDVIAFQKTKSDIEQIEAAGDFGDLAETVQVNQIVAEFVGIFLTNSKGGDRYQVKGSDRGNKSKILWVDGPGYSQDAFCENLDEVDQALNAMLVLQKFAGN